MADISKEDLRKQITGKWRYFSCFTAEDREMYKTRLEKNLRTIFLSGILPVHSRNRAFYSCAIFEPRRTRTMAVRRQRTSRVYMATENSEYLWIYDVTARGALMKFVWLFFSDLRRSFSPRNLLPFRI